jgi:hypothetical protein
MNIEINIKQRKVYVALVPLLSSIASVCPQDWPQVCKSCQVIPVIQMVCIISDEGVKNH